mgnify:CR=1 FL=1
MPKELPTLDFVNYCRAAPSRALLWSGTPTEPTKPTKPTQPTNEVRINPAYLLAWSSFSVVGHLTRRGQAFGFHVRSRKVSTEEPCGGLPWRILLRSPGHDAWRPKREGLTPDDGKQDVKLGRLKAGTLVKLEAGDDDSRVDEVHAVPGASSR